MEDKDAISGNGARQQEATDCSGVVSIDVWSKCSTSECDWIPLGNSNPRPISFSPQMYLGFLPCSLMIYHGCKKVAMASEYSKE